MALLQEAPATRRAFALTQLRGTLVRIGKGAVAFRIAAWRSRANSECLHEAERERQVQLKEAYLSIEDTMAAGLVVSQLTEQVMGLRQALAEVLLPLLTRNHTPTPNTNPILNPNRRPRPRMQTRSFWHSAPAMHERRRKRECRVQRQPRRREYLTLTLIRTLALALTLNSCDLLSYERGSAELTV